jgi:hypothetical protein
VREEAIELMMEERRRRPTVRLLIQEIRYGTVQSFLMYVHMFYLVTGLIYLNTQHISNFP